MSFYRTGLVVCATVFATAMTSVAFAGCGGCGGGFVVQTYAQPLVYGPPVGYAPPAFEYAPQAYAPPIALPPPVAPLPIAAAPIAVDHWDTGGWGGQGWGGQGWGGQGGWGGCGCCGCNRGFFGGGSLFGGPGPAPIYIVNQGPEYSGPGIMIPYTNYAPEAGLAAPGTYPYIGHYRYPRYGYARYGHPYYGARYAYHPHRYWRRSYPHRWRG
jgi:hypothetical protein